jgi:hypothetical protein
VWSVEGLDWVEVSRYVPLKFDRGMWADNRSFKLDLVLDDYTIV